MWATLLLVLLLATSSTVSSSPTASPIQHVVVLMMENRSFDHLLGWLHKECPELDGLTGNEFNPYSTTNPGSQKEMVNDHGFNRAPDDPGHSWASTAEQIYGFVPKGHEKPTPKMNGFVQTAIHRKQTPYNPMSMFNITTAPIINTLAREYAVFDSWHCSLPGPTDPNRAFAMSGTSMGMIDNFNGTLWGQQSYFDYLRVKGKSWRAYYQDDPWAVMYFRDMHQPENKKNVFEMPRFFADVEKNDLPAFTWLQPRMTSAKGPPTWQHPDALITEGERLIKSIYEALRKSIVWESLAFIITYDEHGGFYDHVAPPQTGVPSPDGIPASNGFQFDRLGIRIPTVLVSPWVAKQSVIHKPTSGGPHFDATAMIATSNKIFGIEGHLHARDAWVGTFENVFSLSEPRDDCPMRLPTLEPYLDSDLKIQHALPLNDHLEIQIDFYCKFNGHGPDCGKDITNQYEASVFIIQEAEKFMSK